jgi:hypothetical protein
MKRYLAVEAAPDSRRRPGIIDELYMARLKKILARGLQLNMTARR